METNMAEESDEDIDIQDGYDEALEVEIVAYSESDESDSAGIEISHLL